jgi:N-methylhydantoinase B
MTTTQDAPIAQSGGTTVDPIDFSVIVSSLGGIVREMNNSIYRTGYSTAIRESQDASCGILTVDGRLLGQFAAVPAHMGAYPAILRGLLDRYRLDEMEPGDTFIMNQPYMGGNAHVPDMATASPVFYQGKIVAFCANIAHKSDLGAMVPGGGSAQATEIYHEGTLFPPIKYVAAGKVVRQVEEILRANSRTPDLVIGDLNGQVGAARIGVRQLVALIDRYGLDTVLATAEELFDRTERRVRMELESWPDGVAEAEGFLDNDGIRLDLPIRIHVRIEKRGGTILFDFSGSQEQSGGAVNIRPPLVKACCYYALIGLIDPSMPNNDGLQRVVETRFREGTVLNPTFPAAVNIYMYTLLMTTEVILKALSQFVPDRISAAWGTGAGMTIAHRQTRTGQSYVQYELFGSGSGGRAGKDGNTGVHIHLSNCRVTPVEILEAEFPVRVERFDLVQDSGGPGQWRGGLGFQRQYRLLGEQATWSIRSDRHDYEPWGIREGLGGKPGRHLVAPDTAEEKQVPARYGGHRMKQADAVRLETAGGGGYGNPRERNPELVLADVRNGYVSIESAERDYGVRIQATPNGDYQIAGRN